MDEKVQKALSEKEFQKAQKLFKDQLSEKSSSKDWSNYGYICIQASELDEAEKAIQTSLRLDPNNSGAHFNLGYFYMQKEDWPSALEAFSQVRKESEKLYWNAGLCLMHLKQFPAAIECQQKALNIDPNFVEAQVDLALCLFAMRKLHEAMTVIEKALSQNPKHLRARSVRTQIEKSIRRDGQYSES